ncbi:MAG: hypothetical protein ACXVMS_18170 [Flavisolibacter sp.]
MKREKKKTEKLINPASVKEKIRHREWETPSQQRNRDGLGREEAGSDGSPVRGTGSNH